MCSRVLSRSRVEVYLEIFLGGFCGEKDFASRNLLEAVLRSICPTTRRLTIQCKAERDLKDFALILVSRGEKGMIA